jgi:hypothetical protein
LHLPQRPPPFAQHLEVVVLGAGRGPTRLLPLGVNEGQALGLAGAAVLGRLAQVGQLPKFLGPLLSVPPLGQSAADPAQAVLLDDHEARLLAEEDLIGSRWLDARAAELVEDFQQGGGPAGGGAGPAAQLDHAGQLRRSRALGAGLGQQRDEAAAGDRQADALGLGGTGAACQAIRIEEHRGVQDRPKFAATAAEFGDLLVESSELLGGVLPVEGLEDPVGVPIQGLAREALLGGALDDGAVGPVENGGGIGDAQVRG